MDRWMRVWWPCDFLCVCVCVDPVRFLCTLMSQSGIKRKIESGSGYLSPATTTPSYNFNLAYLSTPEPPFSCKHAGWIKPNSLCV
jgi:hypothetical protein